MLSKLTPAVRRLPVLAVWALLATTALSAAACEAIQEPTADSQSQAFAQQSRGGTTPPGDGGGGGTPPGDGGDRNGSNPPKLTTIQVAPSAVTLAPGATQQFTATGYDQSGQPMTISAVWTATGGTVGSSGFYTAPAGAGLYIVTATDGTVSGSASVTVTQPQQGTIWPTTSWQAASPAAMGMDGSKLNQARNYAGNGSGIITRHGRVVMTWGSQSQRYDVKSVTKSVGATLLGIAMRDGKIGGLDQTAQSLLPEFGTFPSSNIETGWLPFITLRQLSTHTSGFDRTGGFVPLLFQPGTHLGYSDGGVNWLADVLTVRYAQDMNVLLTQRVLGPLGIAASHVEWRDHMTRPGTIQGFKRRELASGISMSVDAMARLGYLYLRGGQWSSGQILDQSFVQLVQQPQPQVVGLPVVNDSENEFGGASNQYGLLWWTNADGSLPNVPRDTYFAWGHGDALIVVIPSLGIVAARAGTAWRGDRSPSFYKIINPFIEAIATSVLY